MTLRILCCFLASFVAGCGPSGPKLVPVAGKVTHKGQPLTAGGVFFHPDKPDSDAKDSPGSQLELDGSFSLKTFPHGEGAIPGKYKATLTPSLANRIGRPQYGDPVKSPWTVEVPDTGLKDTVLEVK